MNVADFDKSENELPLVVDNWPMSLEATRERLKKVEQRLEQYRAALRLSGVEIERRNRGIIALTTFAYQASCLASVNILLKLTLTKALETTGAPVGAIVMIDAETKVLNLNIHKGLTTELADILTGRQLEQGAPALMPHLVAGSGALLELQTTDDDAERLLLAAGRLTSLVSLPIQTSRRLMGTLLIGQQDDQKFGSSDLCFLMAISQEVALVLEGLNLRERLWDTAEVFLGNEVTNVERQNEEEAVEALSTPFELPAVPPLPQPAQDDLEQLLAAMMAAEDEVQQHNTDLQTLNAIGEAMNRILDAKEILQYAVGQTQALLQTDAAWLYLINEGDRLILSAHTGLSNTYVRGMHQLALGEGLEGQVASENKAQFIEVNPADTRAFKIWVDKEQLRALAAVPLTRPRAQVEQTDAHVIGVLAVGKRTTPFNFLWSPREVRLLSSIANQLALAIDNARLYAQIQEDHTYLSAGNAILREVNELLLQRNAQLEEFFRDDLGAALTTASQVINRLLSDKTPVTAETQKQVALDLKRIIDRLDDMLQQMLTSS
jgi:GAF domain-containing protein